MSNLIDELEREKAHSDLMTAAAETWRVRAENAERLLAVATLAAGGNITIHLDHMADADAIELIREESPVDYTCRLRAVVKDQQG